MAMPTKEHIISPMQVSCNQSVFVLLCALSAFDLKSEYFIFEIDLESCKEYDTKLGYGYHDYFAIENIKDAQFPDDILRVNLYVLAAKDAHILLSPTDQQDKSSAVYEIGKPVRTYAKFDCVYREILFLAVIGAGSNTFVEIRRQRQTQPLRTIRFKNILSPINPLPLTIRITVDGVIDVRITGQEHSIISATDKNPLTIKYISFSSWGNTEGKWFFDCAGDKDDRLEEVLIRHRSLGQIFREALFAEYDINVVPMNLSQINWAFKLKYADFDAKKSQVLVRGKFKAVIRCLICMYYRFTLLFFFCKKKKQIGVV